MKTPKFKPGDRVVLTPQFKEQMPSRLNPVWGSPYGYVLGTIKKHAPSQAESISDFFVVVWDSDDTWCYYCGDDLRAATKLDEALAAEYIMMAPDTRTLAYLFYTQKRGFYIGISVYTGSERGELREKDITYLYTTRALTFEELNPSDDMNYPDKRIIQSVADTRFSLSGYRVSNHFQAYHNFCVMHDLPLPNALPDPLLMAPTMKWVMTGVHNIHNPKRLAVFVLEKDFNMENQPCIYDWIYKYASEFDDEQNDTEPFTYKSSATEALAARLSRAAQAS